MKKKKKYIGIDPATGLYNFIGKEADKALKTFGNSLLEGQKETEAGQQLKDSLKDAITKAKLTKAIEKMLDITSLGKKKKKKK